MKLETRGMLKENGRQRKGDGMRGERNWSMTVNETGDVEKVRKAKGKDGE